MAAAVVHLVVGVAASREEDTAEGTGAAAVDLRPIDPRGMPRVAGQSAFQVV